jgi:heat shock protein HtpX
MPIGLILTMTLTMMLLFGVLFGLLAIVGLYFSLNGFMMVGLAVGMVVFQWLIGPAMIRWTTNMRDMKKGEYPWIEEFVAELCKKHRLKMPKLAIVNDAQPNAFVFGRTNSSASLCVTQGLLKSLNKDEVKGVLAHEIGHIKHNDMVVMVIISAIPMIAFFVARFLLFAPKGGEKKDMGYLILVGVVAWVVYFLTNLLVMFFSRIREYYADRFGGLNYRTEALASALAKITYGLGLSKSDMKSAAQAFFIADPYTSHFEVSHFSIEFSDMHISKDEVKKAMEWEKKNMFAKLSELFRTHPLTFKRIRALHRLQEEMEAKKR